MEHIVEQNGRNWQVVRREYGRLLRLGMSMLRIGTIGFGGGNALIPVIEEEVVTRGRLVDKRAYEEDVIAACITPGALPVEIAAGIGRRLGGFSGMLLAATMMAFPGALFTIFILAALTGEQGSVLTGIRFISLGLGAFIISLLLSYVLKTLNAVRQAGRRTFRAMYLVMMAVFLLSSGKNIFALLGIAGQPALHLSVLATLGLAFFLIICWGNSSSGRERAIAFILAALFLLSGSEGTSFSAPLLHDASILLMGLWGGKKMFLSFQTGGAGVNRSRLLRDTLLEAAVWSGFILFFSLPALMIVPESFRYLAQGFLSSLLSFGGGDAYLTIADGIFVQGGTTGAEAFYGQLVPVANALPGSILCKILTGIGYLAGFRQGGILPGLLLSLAGFAVSVAASGLIFGLVARLLQTFQDVPVFRQISLWVRPIISGLLLNVALSMLRANLDIGAGLGLSPVPVAAVMIIFIAASLYAVHYRHYAMSLPMLAAAGGGLSLALL